MWMHAPAFRIVKAFQNNGVHADSFKPWILQRGLTTQRHIDAAGT